MWQSQDCCACTLGCPSPSLGVYTYQMVETAAQHPGGWVGESSRSLRRSVSEPGGTHPESVPPKGSLETAVTQSVTSTSREETGQQRSLFPGAGSSHMQSTAECIQKGVCRTWRTAVSYRQMYLYPSSHSGARHVVLHSVSGCHVHQELCDITVRSKRWCHTANRSCEDDTGVLG